MRHTVTLPHSRNENNVFREGTTEISALKLYVVF